MSRLLGVTASSRLIGVTTTAFGAVLLARPGDVARTVAGGALPGRGWIRLLGVRYLAQGAAQTALPGPAVLEVSVVVDTLHAASMVALALLRAEYRRPAVLSAAAATASAAVTGLQARRLHKTGT